MTTIFSSVGGDERICFLDDEITVPLGTMRATGDFVRVQNAKLFFLGRKDNQIKRHGKRFNIECLQQVIYSYTLYKRAGIRNIYHCHQKWVLTHLQVTFRSHKETESMYCQKSGHII